MTDNIPALTTHPAERRAHRRLDVRLPVELRSLDRPESPVVRATTRNISTGGLYFELDRPDFSTGHRVNVTLSIPPAEGVSAFHGTAICGAEIVRCDPSNDDSRTGSFGVAARFLEDLRLRY